MMRGESPIALRTASSRETSSASVGFPTFDLYTLEALCYGFGSLFRQLLSGKL